MSAQTLGLPTRAGLVAIGVLLVAMVGTPVLDAHAAPQPTYGTADPDGSSAEWNLGADRMGDVTGHPLGQGSPYDAGDVHVRYDCDTSTLFLLLTIDDVFPDRLGFMAPPPPPLVNVDGSDTTPGDDAFIEETVTPPQGSPYTVRTGWEASIAGITDGDHNVTVTGSLSNEDEYTVDVDITIDCPTPTPPPPPRYTLTIVKSDAVTASPMAGVGFEVFRDDGDGELDDGDTSVATVTTDDDGEATLSGLRGGTYWVVEQPVDGYVSAAPVAVSLTGNRTVEIANEPIRHTLTIVKSDALTGAPMGDVHFELLLDDGDGALDDDDPPVTTTTTAENGRAAVNDLDPAVYWLVETTPAGYHPGDPLRIDLTEDRTVEITNLPIVTDLRLDKRVVETHALDTVGGTVRYLYSIGNLGNVGLEAVTLTDDVLGELVIPADGLDLAPGEIHETMATHTLTQADLDRGEATNIAVAAGTPVSGGDPLTDDATATVELLQAPDIGLDATVTEGEGDLRSATLAAAAADLELTIGADDDNPVLVYTYVLTNTGNTTLTDAALTSTRNHDVPLGVTTLAPGETTTVSVTSPLDDDDVAAETIDDEATATGIGPDGTGVSDTDATSAAVTVVKGVIEEPEPAPEPAPEPPRVTPTVETLPATGLQDGHLFVLALAVLMLGWALVVASAAPDPWSRRPDTSPG